MTSNEFFTSEVAKFISKNGHKFHDAKLVTSDSYKYPINKVVLAVRSDFFKCLFKKEGTACSARGKRQLHEYILPSTSSQALEPILHWVYNNEFTVDNMETVLMVLESAEFLGLLGMSAVCQEWIKNKMDAENVLGALRFAECHFLEQLGKDAWDLLKQNLPQVAKGEEWLKLDTGQVAKIIATDELLCKEEEVWIAVIRWAMHHQKMDKDIIKEVRLGLLAEDFYKTEVVNHPLMENNPITVKVNKYFKTLSTLPIQDVEPLETPSFAVPRCPSVFLFIFGGWSLGSPISTICVYDPRAHMWQRVDLELPFPWVYMGSVTHNNKVYLAGGNTYNPADESTEIIRNLWKFDPETMSFRKLSHMREKRNYTCMVTLNDEIYALGGHSGSNEGLEISRLNSGEVYKISRNQWYRINPMKTIRSDFGATVLDGKIYAVGGLDGSRPSKTAEIFTPATGEWKLLRPMQSPRSGVKCVALRGMLVVIGGFDGKNRLSSGEFFNPKNSSWSYLPKMKTPRSNHALSVVEGKIVAIGGFEGSNTTDHVEMFDWDLWRWVTAGKLPTRLSAMASAVVVTTELGVEARERFRFKERMNILEEKKIRIENERNEMENENEDSFVMDMDSSIDSDSSSDSESESSNDSDSSNDVEENDITFNE